MSSAAPIVAPHAAAALHAALRSRGFAMDDFGVCVDGATDCSQALGMPAGLIKVRCRSTGEERMYPLGAGSAWLGAFVMDLDGGHFARAARTRRDAAPNVVRRSLVQRLRDGGRELARAFDGGRVVALAPPVTSPR
jgi:hypothetical protein